MEGFYRSAATKDGLQNECKKCTKDRHSEPKNKARRREYAWAVKLREEFGMSTEDYWEMFDRQGGRCAICRAVPDWKRLAVDHDHETGEVRGLLCNSCNCGLGFFKDDPHLVAQALMYLKG